MAILAFLVEKAKSEGNCKRVQVVDRKYWFAILDLLGLRPPRFPPQGGFRFLQVL
jgi:hypothetical protein